MSQGILGSNQTLSISLLSTLGLLALIPQQAKAQVVSETGDSEIKVEAVSTNTSTVVTSQPVQSPSSVVQPANNTNTLVSNSALSTIGAPLTLDPTVANMFSNFASSGRGQLPVNGCELSIYGDAELTEVGGITGTKAKVGFMYSFQKCTNPDTQAKSQERIASIQANTQARAQILTACMSAGHSPKVCAESLGNLNLLKD
jgi:hypothetical protein